MTKSTQEGRKSPFTALLDEIGSIWFGVTMLVLIFVYSWLGSAGLQPFYNWFPRQTLEMTEMEWFSWWPFQAMVFLLCLSIAIITIRKIPFNLPNLGVWTVHVGILVLCLGCVIYFGLKLEGDMPVYKRQVVLKAPGGDPVEMHLLPGVTKRVEGDGVSYDVRVQAVMHDYELLTGEDEGKTTYMTQLQVLPYREGQPGQPFTRQLLDGYPEYTEDVIPGEGRAVKVRGEALVDTALEASMTYHDPQYIYLHNRPALRLRRAGTHDEWSEIALRGLPRYSEHVDHDEQVMVQPGQGALRAKSLRMERDFKADPGELADDYEVVVTGFMPYAVLREQWTEGGNEVYPMARLALQMGESRSTHQLFAFDPRRSRESISDDFGVRFEWVESEERLEELLNPEPPSLNVRVPSVGIEREILVGDALDAPVSLGKSGYAIQVSRVFPTWSMGGGGGQSSMVLLDIDTPSGSFSRAVIHPQKERTLDLDAQGQMKQGPPDPRIEVEVSSIPDSGLVVVGGPVGSHLLFVNLGGSVLHEEVSEGGEAAFLDGALRVRLIDVSERARRERVPLVVPREERNLRAGASYSLVQVEVRRGEESERRWLEYSHYGHQSRYGFNPEVFELGGGPPIEVVYTRETHKLPAPVALETFKLETYPGGEKERDYISLVRFFEEGEWSGLHEVRSNQPTEHAGWWYFQSTWDPPDEQRGYAGQFFTGLGVGNRHGVFTMLFGSILTVIGTVYAFYVKPVILRRRLEARGELERPVEATPSFRPAAASSVPEGHAAMAGAESDR